MSIPVEHIEESQKLVADGRVDLYRIVMLTNETIYIKSENSVTWQGNFYEALAVVIAGVSRNVTGTSSRPSLTIVNPEGVFSPLVAQGLLERAIVTRYRVLHDHILADLPIAQRQSWRVNRITSLNSQFVAMEMGDLSDGPNFLVPAGMFIPPTFPLVSLS